MQCLTFGFVMLGGISEVRMLVMEQSEVGMWMSLPVVREQDLSTLHSILPFSMTSWSRINYAKLCNALDLHTEKLSWYICTNLSNSTLSNEVFLLYATDASTLGFVKLLLFLFGLPQVVKERTQLSCSWTEGLWKTLFFDLYRWSLFCSNGIDLPPAPQSDRFTNSDQAATAVFLECTNHAGVWERSAGRLHPHRGVEQKQVDKPAQILKVFHLKQQSSGSMASGSNFLSLVTQLLPMIAKQNLHVQ